MLLGQAVLQYAYKMGVYSCLVLSVAISINAPLSMLGVNQNVLRLS